VVGLTQSLSITSARAALDKSNKADGDESTFIGGRRNSTVSFGGVFDHTEDAGYTILSTSYESSAGTVWFLLSPLNASDTEWYGSGIVTQLDKTLDDEAVSGFTCTIQVSGALTEVTDGGT